MKTKKLIWALFRVIIVVYLILVAIMFLWQERLIFFPEKLRSDFKFGFPHASEKWIDFEGSKIHSLLFRSLKSKGAMLYFHGNAGSLAGWGEIGEELLARTGWDVWIVDYPGYGKSEGSISSEDQLHKMASAFFAEASKEYSQFPILLYGRSIGSGMAVKLAAENAAENKIAGLILETPFLNIAAVAKAHYPWAPGSILKYKFPSDEWISKVTAPVLILHGNADEIIPFEQGKRLSEIKSDAGFVAVDGGSHNNLAAYQEYWMGLKPWLERQAVRTR